MIQTFRMAWRDLGRNRRRSFLSALAVGLGLALLLFLASFIQGEMKASIDTSIRLQTGHLQVRADSYDEVKTSLKWADLIDNPQAIADQIAALPQVEVASPRLYATGIVSVGDETAGVRVIGIDPASAASQPYKEKMAGGDFLSADDREGLLLGQALADKLDLKVGDTVNLSVNTSNGDVANQNFILRGIFNTDTYAFDSANILLPLAKAQAISGAENHASTIYVLLKDMNQVDAVAPALQSSTLKVLTWKDMNELLLQIEQLANSYMVFFYLIVLGISATVVVNTLIMSVFERTREIGILTAIGMRSRRIMGMFLAESSLLAVGGIIMGLILGVIFATVLGVVGFPVGQMKITGFMLSNRIYPVLTFKDSFNLSLMALVITLLAGIYPAWFASHLEPVEALHGGK
jgi:putative ABC transport system permease protein